jgi:pheophorbide a oxygenase
VQVSKEVLPPEQVLDRYNQHVKNCPKCRGALRNIQRGIVAAAVAGSVAVISGVAMIASSEAWQAVLAWVGVALVSLGAWAKLKALEQKFFYQPYVHADKD